MFPVQCWLHRAYKAIVAARLAVRVVESVWLTFRYKYFFHYTPLSCRWQSVELSLHHCQYRFSGKPISTYMSLTLARLCGEWRLVCKNYEARGASGGKYKAQIVIFRILAAKNRFSCISRKSESRWGKLESRWRNQKAVEESGKPLKKIDFFVRKIGV